MVRIPEIPDLERGRRATIVRAYRAENYGKPGGEGSHPRFDVVIVMVNGMHGYLRLFTYPGYIEEQGLVPDMTVEIAFESQGVAWLGVKHTQSVLQFQCDIPA